MKIRIDLERCKGHQACLRAAPQVFRINDEGFSQLANGDTVPPDMYEDVLIAADNCPEFAIEILDQEAAS
ncbi:MAG: ferredoxin [Burkholderiaceae bacterium]|nr:ferredoxin [Burkholderiaceae bacterium]